MPGRRAEEPSAGLSPARLLASHHCPYGTLLGEKLSNNSFSITVVSAMKKKNKSGCFESFSKDVI